MSEIKKLFGRAVLFLTICAGTGVAQAQVFNYNPGGYGTAGDVLVCFRYVNPGRSTPGNMSWWWTAVCPPRSPT